MKELNVLAKVFDKEYLRENNHIIFKNRELIVERDPGTDDSDTTYRFKIGDGVTPYRDLKYISSIYNLFPSFTYYDKDYETAIHFNLKG